MKTKTRRITCLGLTVLMSASTVMASVLAAIGGEGNTLEASASKNTSVSFDEVTGTIDLTSVALKNMSSSVIANTLGTTASETRTAIITLDTPSVLESKPKSLTAAEYLDTFSGSRTLASIEASQDKFLRTLSSSGISYTVKDRYTTLVNAVAVEMKVSDFVKVKNLSGSVTSAVLSESYAAPTSAVTSSTGAQSNPSNVYATGIYDSSAYTALGYDGSGVTVAIIDTGLDYTHEAFSKDPDESQNAISLTKSKLSEKLNSNAFNATKLSEGIDANDLYVSKKVPFAYDYADRDTDVYPSYSQHGTHVAGIVAGQADSYTNKDGETAVDSNGDKLSFVGVAPEAQLVICKVFTDNLESKDLGGAVTEDIVAALEDCVLLNVDIINMSLGTSAGFSSVTIDGDTEGELLNTVYSSIENAGIALICAASNDFSSGYGGNFGTNLASNPDSGTVGSPSTYSGAMSVASINGQKSPYMIANGKDAVFYLESNDANSVSYNFANGMLGEDTSVTSHTYKYVVIPGVGQAADYTTKIRKLLTDKEAGEKVIAVVQRGTISFEDKVSIAERMGADAIIVYNNVAGTVRMSIGNLINPIPAVSVNLDAGQLLVSGATGSVGTIEVNRSYEAGPFMNDYSSWGATPDLKLKPDVTAHGGEITSTVSGGYTEMSGTSMASPNMAGFMALVRGYIKTTQGITDAVKLTQLTNQMVMSTAETVYNENGLAYSPRKQGAGLATLSNVFSTQAYLYTDSEENGGKSEDNRPKYELGDDKDKTGVYEISFYVKNFGSSDLSFTAQTLFMTETLSVDGLAVAEQAHMLTDNAAVWTVNGTNVAEGSTFTVPSGKSYKITVKLTLSDAEKKYIDTNFANGMYVEGFIKLVGSDGQCDLNLPFMGFYGDWDSAPMLDYSAFEIAAFKQDTSYNDDERPQASVWATQAYASYYNDQYSVPLGSFLYVQDESAEQIYADQEHAAISRYKVYNGEDDTTNYLTTTSIKALYAGLLRNAELVRYDLRDAETGEYILKDSEVYRVNKAYAGGGSAVPSNVLLELDPLDLGLISNGKYEMEFRFYRKAEDADDPTKQSEDNTFTMTFYVDYDAPVLVDSRIRFYDYKDGNKEKQRVYLDLDVYDNHYAQSVILCYSEVEGDDTTLTLATPYVTPVYNANKNGTTTVSIEITDIYNSGKYKNSLYVQLDDYALNHSVYRIDISDATTSGLPSEFEVDGDTNITLGVNETYKIALKYEGSANLSNFTWTSSAQRIVQVQNGELFGVKAGTATVTITGANQAKRVVNVTVVESNSTIGNPSISFGIIKNSDDGLVKATGTVKVNAGQTFQIPVLVEPWYYPTSGLTYKWTTDNEEIATVTQDGTVTIGNTKGTAIIKAVLLDSNGNETSFSTLVSLSVQEPFTVSSYTLTKYSGSSAVVTIPDDKNITTIGEESFKDNTSVEVVIIPKTVTTIKKNAFKGCTSLKEIYFISTEPDEEGIAHSSLALIERYAFSGCTALEKVDLSNVKTITLDREVFTGCTSLKEIVKMDAIGTMGNRTFANCTSLTSVDLTGLHMSGSNVFEGCTAIQSVKTGYFTDLGSAMFKGCTALTSVVINTPTVGANAFEGCTSLTSVEFANSDNATDFEVVIGAYAFRGATKLNSVTFTAVDVREIGDEAFANTALSTFTLPNGSTTFGSGVFKGTSVSIALNDSGTYSKDSYGAIYRGTELVLAPKTIASDFTIASNTTKIGSYAFSDCTLASGVTTLTLPASLETLGEGAFYDLAITSLDLSGTKVTTLSDLALAGSGLTSFAVPAKVTTIGAGALANCYNLTAVTFATDSALVQIGDLAFANATKLTSVTLPDGVKTMGSFTFRGCSALETATLPSVETLGEYTFWGATALTTAIFGANAKTTGDYTFYPGYASSTSGMQQATSSLTSVTLGAVAKIGDGAFMYCDKLASIDLNGATEIGDETFAGCSSLTTVSGLENIVTFGEYALADTKLAALNLTSAQTVGAYAFYAQSGASYTALQIPSVQTIGTFAFFGGKETSVSLPATLSKVGYGAFASSSRLNAFTVDSANTSFFAENGILYRYITDTSYELCAYPSGKTATVAVNPYTEKDSLKTVSLKEGTATVQAYAFAYLTSATVLRVVLPYSVKTIGDAAFYSSGISEYIFESIQAPVLLSEYREYTSSSGVGIYALNNANFEQEVRFLSGEMFTTPLTSSLKLYYPSNGSGYNNYLYTLSFGSSADIGELMDDDTRTLKEMIASFYDVATVSAWETASVTEELSSTVTSFSDTVKEAYRLYSNIRSSVQLDYLGEENINTLKAVATALKPVKTRFGITVKATSLTLDADSAHRTTYTAGEKFDMTGLKMTVTYDDYTTEQADLNELQLGSSYQGELDELMTYVLLTGYGVQVRLPITVTAGGVTESGESSSFNPAVIYGPIIGVVVLAAIAVGVVFLLKKKKAAAGETVADATQPNADGKSEDEDKKEN